MPYRKVIFANKEIYHIINRGVASEEIFLNKRDYERALEVIDYYQYNPSLSFSHYNRMLTGEKKEYFKGLKQNNAPIVEILAYCLMPNHFHLLLRQLQDKGISIFLRNLQNSYAKYFNTKNRRLGPLFQSMFKAIRVETEEQLIHLSRYIHLNPSSAYLVEFEKMETYKWSSLPEYVGLKEHGLSSPDFVLGLDYFRNHKETYRKFVLNRAEYQRNLQKIKRLTLERNI